MVKNKPYEKKNQLKIHRILCKYSFDSIDLSSTERKNN